MAIQQGAVGWHGEQALVRARAGAIHGLTIAGEYLLGESRRLVPHDEGTLERSGVSDVRDAELEVVVSYDTPYAVRQHEDLTAHHEPGRSAKYLERPLTEHADTIRDLIGEHVRRALAG